MTCIRIAVVGLGPRGLTILERILEHAHQLPASTRLAIDVYDDGVPGEGSHPSQQPDHLLINTVASQVTIFASGSKAGGPEGISLVDWAYAAGYRRVGDRFLQDAGDTGVPITQADHLPRRLLGAYLAWAYRRVVAMLPAAITVEPHRARVVDLVDEPAGFQVVCASGAQHPADYVFLATGHGHRRPTAEDHALATFANELSGRNRHLAYFASPYPIDALDRIAAAATVAVQGLGLTAHDVVSALTLGRGGRYIEEAGHLRYQRSGDEPRLLLFSRNSLPFAARGVNQKGLTGRHQARFFTVDAITHLRQQAFALRGDPRLDFQAEVLPLVLREMAYAHRCAETGRECTTEGFEATQAERRTVESLLWPLKDRSFASFDAFHSFVHTWITVDLQEAARGNRSSPVKAATDVLRDTREALRTAVEHGGLTPDSHRLFVEDFNAATNRVAFGPPRQRNAEYLALRQAGMIDITGGPGTRLVADRDRACFRVETAYAEGVQYSHADALVVARLDPYSPLTDSAPLSAQLLARGLVRPFRNGDYHPGGIDIDAQMHPIGASGQACDRLWIVGFPVEGPHFYTHALPRPHILSRQTVDAERCVLELFGTLALRPSASRNAAQSADVVRSVPKT